MIAAGSLRVFLAVSLVAARAWASPWALDPSATRIEFSVRNLSVARVDGTFRLASGHVTLDDEDPSRSTIEAVIDAASVDTSEPKRDAHLRSADFLDVACYPTIAFRSTRIERADGGHWRVTGDLTLLGRTRSVLLAVDSSTSEGTRSSAHATTTIDRRDFGMTYAGFAVGKQVEGRSTMSDMTAVLVAVMAFAVAAAARLSDGTETDSPESEPRRSMSLSDRDSGYGSVAKRGDHP